LNLTFGKALTWHHGADYLHPPTLPRCNTRQVDPVDSRSGAYTVTVVTWKYLSETYLFRWTW